MKKKISIASLKKSTQIVFNNYIRMRDTLYGEEENGADDEFICISCGRILPKKQMQCGHYFPIKRFQHLRFNEDNAHGECQACNGFNDAHLIYYTWHLIYRIGQQRYDELFAQSTTKPPDFTREQLEEIKLKYGRKSKG